MVAFRPMGRPRPGKVSMPIAPLKRVSSESMRYCVLALILAGGIVAGMGCQQISAGRRPGTGPWRGSGRQDVPRQRMAAGDEPALRLDDEPLLLLDDGSGVASPAGTVADNSRCHVCHMNYMQEEVAVIHAQANMGCKDCHGDSDAHIADESWSWGGKGTAPDVMYTPAEINPFCARCHPEDKIETKEHESLFAGTAEEVYCTDCHGQHRLAQRRCKWK